MDLERVIKTLTKGLKEDAPYLQTLRYPQKLLTALNELHEVIGNKEAKDVLARRVVSHLIRNYQRKNDPTMPPSNFISNIILGGKPGTGKTMLAQKIAKIIGYMDFFEHLRPSNKKQKDLILQQSIPDIMVSRDFWATVLIICTALFMIFGTFLATLFTLLPIKYTIVMILILLLLILLIAYFWTLQNFAEGENSSNPFDNLLNPIEKSKSLRDWNNDDVPVIILKRNDFVGKYVGHTQAKTLDLLKNARGCVVFIDEAYQLVNGGESDFGHELLTTINQFMSEQPNDILFIFAGYVHLIERNLFTSQPGLRSRFSTILNCGGYNAEDLCAIYCRQLLLEGRHFDKKYENELNMFFNKSVESFVNYGRDTLRLAEYTIQEKDCEIFRGQGDFGTINMEHVRKAYIMLLNNQFIKDEVVEESNKEDKISYLRDLMKNL